MRSIQEKKMTIDEYNIYWTSYRSASEEDLQISKCIAHADDCLSFYRDLQNNVGENS